MSKPALNCGTITLNNGVKMPKLGLGTWLSQPGLVKKAVEIAIDNGYRHIDCAYLYNNENEVGEAIKNKINQGVVTRQDLFIVSKLWVTFCHPSRVEEYLNKSLKNLGLNYLDLYLVHFPTPLKFIDEKTFWPLDGNSAIMDNETNYTATFQKLISIKNSTTKLKSIGVSNFNSFQIKNLVKCCSEKPQMNQIECHPYLNCSELINCCKSFDIHITCYSPLGNPARPEMMHSGQKVLMEDKVVKEIAENNNKSVAQILIKWSVQRGNVCIPKSTTPSRIISNSEIFDFELSNKEMLALDGINCNTRYLEANLLKKSRFYPWVNDYKECIECTDV